MSCWLSILTAPDSNLGRSIDTTVSQGSYPCAWHPSNSGSDCMVLPAPSKRPAVRSARCDYDRIIVNAQEVPGVGTSQESLTAPGTIPGSRVYPEATQPSDPAMLAASAYAPQERAPRGSYDPADLTTTVLPSSWISVSNVAFVSFGYVLQWRC